MNLCPEYRVRLFLSVDLVNSTAFKSGAKAPNGSLYPLWVDKFKSFYRQFPLTLEANYRQTKSCRIDDLAASSGPKLWKLVGDEIVFCCRVESLQHLCCCVSAFLDTLEEYGSALDDDPETAALDVKGAGWVAESPIENVSLRIEGGNLRSTPKGVDYVTEAFEREADETPAFFDFIGTAIDAGFRSAKIAAPDRFSASVELAYLLAEANTKNLFSRTFTYHGRTSHKGVHRNTPYPTVTIDTERDPVKRELRTRERMLTQEPEVPGLVLREFLQAYIDFVGLNIPCLKLKAASDPVEPPPAYQHYKSSWDVSAQGTVEQDQSIDRSEETINAGDEEVKPLDPAVTAFANSFKADANGSFIKDPEMVRHAIMITNRLRTNQRRKRLAKHEYKNPAETDDD